MKSDLSCRRLNRTRYVGRASRRRCPVTWIAFLLLAIYVGPPPVEAQSGVSLPDLDALVAQLQSLVENGDRQGFLDLLTAEADAEAGDAFVRKALHAGVSTAAVRARFLVPLEDYPAGTAYRFTIEVFTERGDTGRLQTWQLDVTRSVMADPRGRGRSQATRGRTQSRDCITSR